MGMTMTNDLVPEDRAGSPKAASEGGDWISKYLDLADKMIRTHMPDGTKEPSGD